MVTVKERIRMALYEIEKQLNDLDTDYQLRDIKERAIYHNIGLTRTNVQMVRMYLNGIRQKCLSE